MGDSRRVLLVISHGDTADLYTIALENAGYQVARAPRLSDAARACRDTTCDAVIVNVLPRDDASRMGAAFRDARPGLVLIGLLSMQLPLATLEEVLRVFDEVVLIPCAPDALVSRLDRLLQQKK